MATTAAAAAAIHLNHVGVSLLEQHCYRQAMRTLGDAISLIKQIVNSKDASYNNLHRLTMRANQRLKQPKPSCMTSCLHIHVACDDDDNVANWTWSLGTVVLLRTSYNHMSILSATIMYNYALCYTILASIHPSPSLVSGSYQLLLLARASLEHSPQSTAFGLIVYQLSLYDESYVNEWMEWHHMRTSLRAVGPLLAPAA